MSNDAYHHGNLRSALIEAALRLVERGGPPSVSLRAVAREVGVSQAAPYAHFRDKRALMSAIAALGFERLRDRLREAERAGCENLTELGKAYLAFAHDNPGLYGLMFGPETEVDPADPALAQAGREAFAILARSSARPGDEGPGDPGPVAAWALVHGLALLSMSGRLPVGAGEAPDRVLKLLQPGIDAHRGEADAG